MTELTVVDCISTSKHEKESKSRRLLAAEQRKKRIRGVDYVSEGLGCCFYIASPRTPFRFPFDDDANAVMPEELKFLVER